MNKFIADIIIILMILAFVVGITMLDKRECIKSGGEFIFQLSGDNKCIYKGEK